LCKRNPKKAKRLDVLSLADLERRIHELPSKVPENSFEPVAAAGDIPSYVGLRALPTANEETKPNLGGSATPARSRRRWMPKNGRIM
jgi:hypothetical protein